jgi:hypothetical protein
MYRYPQRAVPTAAPGEPGVALPTSVSGIAFAVSVAAFQALRSRDLPTSTGAISLLKVSLPLSIDGLSFAQGSSDSAVRLQVLLAESNRNRVQHLLGLSDQVRRNPTRMCFHIFPYTHIFDFDDFPGSRLLVSELLGLARNRHRIVRAADASLRGSVLRSPGRSSIKGG